LYWRSNNFAKSEFSLNLHIYAEFYYVALILWSIADFHVLGQHHPLALLCPKLCYNH
jgi:hypothetical protein